MPQAQPLDNGDAKVDLTLAYAGLRKNFEHPGFTKPPTPHQS
ncbi:hypothetical protein AB0E63_41720 [Kribbella sp. NPDC026596]